jgi:O-antigen/teichoic acid export membrane protein
LATSRVIGTALKAINRPLDAGVAELVGLAVTAVSLAILLPLLGLMGAGLASVLAYAATMSWVAWKAMRALDLTLFELLLDPRQIREALGGLARRIGRSPRGRTDHRSP